ncbi:MAG: hypothetical protein JWO81_1121, partial [Alphaproteobacteria bacterium]|nr:hypothetical protein [Alphaproteobacteria bacterium]
FHFVDGATAFDGQAGDLIAVQGAGNSPIWTVSGDVDGDGTADFELIVVIADAHPITHTDFHL